MWETISPSTARRTRRDVDNSAEHCYHLFANLESWSTEHNGHSERHAPGDIVFLGEGEHRTCAPNGFRGVLLKCPTHWVHSWLPDPSILAGRRISKSSLWGRVLSPLVSQLRPEVVVAPPVPQAVMVDQIGAVLALIAGDAERQTMPDMVKKIRRQIEERCSNHELTAADVAMSLNVPVEVVHRALAGNNQIFAAVLQQARIDKSLKLFRSPSLNRLSPAEIGRLAGFLSPRHFARVMHKRTGLSLLELRAPGAGPH
jgi:AraC-like DNA-binding protein